MKLNVLSLFDGVSCGMVALERAGFEVERYVAYEIDKFAIKTSQKNYPQIEHRGDVFSGDFTEFKGFDLLLGGSPCTYWSIAKNNRETTPDGIGGQLFMQYVRALKESEIPYFLYENNFSIHKNIQNFISEQLGVTPILINSALVSAQTRKRLYWTNIPGITQPEDRNIYVEDILTGGGYNAQSEKLLRDGLRVEGYNAKGSSGETPPNACVSAYLVKFSKGRRQLTINNTHKSLCVIASYHNSFGRNQTDNAVAERINNAAPGSN